MIAAVADVAEGTLHDFITARRFVGEEQTAAFLHEFDHILFVICADCGVSESARKTLPRYKGASDPYVKALELWAGCLGRSDNFIITKAPVIWPAL